MIVNSPIWPKSKTVHIRVYDETDDNLDVNWTATGVTEVAVTDDYSRYKYEVTVESGHEYTIDFKTIEDSPYFSHVQLRKNDTTSLSLTAVPYVVKTDINANEYDEYNSAIQIFTGTTPELIFTVTKDGDAVTLTGKTVYLIIKKDDKTVLTKAIINKAGTVYDTNKVRFNLSLAETQALTGKEGSYQGQLDIGPDETVTPKFNVVIERKLRQ